MDRRWSPQESSESKEKPTLEVPVADEVHIGSHQGGPGRQRQRAAVLDRLPSHGELEAGAEHQGGARQIEAGDLQVLGEKQGCPQVRRNKQFVARDRGLLRQAPAGRIGKVPDTGASAGPLENGGSLRRARWSGENQHQGQQQTKRSRDCPR